MLGRVGALTLYLAAIPAVWSGDACRYEDQEGTGVASGHPLSSISGTVIDAAGKPVEGLELQLAAIAENGETGELLLSRYGCASGESGRFTMKGIPPGRYYLGANLTELTNAKVPRTFYPGSHTREKAIPLDVRPGQKMEGLILSIPDYGGKRKLRIQVVNEHGAPVPDTPVISEYFGGDEAGERAALDRSTKTGPNGVASAEALAGAWYRIGAETLGRGIAIPPGESDVTILLILRGPVQFKDAVVFY